jgi:uncharacterized protein
MPDVVLEQTISSFMSLDMPCYNFGWQGGEPTLMGLDFYKKAVALMQRFGAGSKQVANGFQTNGILLDDAWCSFLRQYNFLVGVSIDGPENIHNANRVYLTGAGSHHDVMRGLTALRRNDVEYNVLTLVSSSNESQPLDIYHYLRDDLNIKFHQYIECVEFGNDGKIMPFSVSPEKWGEFLCKIFDEWYQHDTQLISIRLFDSIIARIIDGTTNVCSLAENCCQYFVIEHDGSIFPCDFFVQPEWCLGKVDTVNWKKLQEIPLYQKFGKQKSIVSEQCSTCCYYRLCAGCCQKNRFGCGDKSSELSILCAGWKLFYEHTLVRFKELAQLIIRERNPYKYNLPLFDLTNPNTQSKNSLCHCGSGNKFKKCCGAHCI